MKNFYLMMLYLSNILLMRNNHSFYLIFDYCYIIRTFLKKCTRQSIIKKKWKRESILPREKGLTPWMNTKYVIIKLVCRWMVTVWRTRWVFLAFLLLLSPPWTFYSFKFQKDIISRIWINNIHVHMPSDIISCKVIRFISYHKYISIVTSWLFSRLTTHPKLIFLYKILKWL